LDYHHNLLMLITGFHRISVNPSVCGGRPTVQGTRMRVSDILDMLAGGASTQEILDDFPYIVADDIGAVLHYAAAMADHPIVIAAE
jgi:uncharacterized protein (DUF433 family)